MASDIRHLQCILFVWSWFHWTLKQMISDTGCQHDSSQLLSCHYDRTRTGTSHVHIKSNGHTTLVITNTMELDKARSFYNGCFHTRIPPPCKQCCQVRLHKQTTKTDAFFLTCKLPPSCLTWNITYIPKLISFFWAKRESWMFIVTAGSSPRETEIWVTMTSTLSDYKPRDVNSNTHVGE